MTSLGTSPSSEDMRHTIVLAVLAVLLASSTARAESIDDKSPTLATVASVGATVGAIGLAIRSGEETGLYLASAGLLLGPSVGHWYAGDAAVPGLVLRGAGFGLMALTVASAFDCRIDDSHSPSCSAATAGFVVGFGVMVVGVLYDFGTAGDSARRANLRTVKLAPAMVAGPHSQGAGLGLTTRF